MEEILIAIALLCQVNTNNAQGPKHHQMLQKECQKKLIRCVLEEPGPVSHAMKLAKCIQR